MTPTDHNTPKRHDVLAVAIAILMIAATALMCVDTMQQSRSDSSISATGESNGLTIEMVAPTDIVPLLGIAAAGLALVRLRQKQDS